MFRIESNVVNNRDCLRCQFYSGKRQPWINRLVLVYPSVMYRLFFLMAKKNITDSALKLKSSKECLSSIWREYVRWFKDAQISHTNQRSQPVSINTAPGRSFPLFPFLITISQEAIWLFSEEDKKLTRGERMLKGARFLKGRFLKLYKM